MRKNSLMDMIRSEALEPVLSVMRESAGLDAEQTRAVFLTVAMFAHGYASIIANNGFIEGKQNEPLMRLFGHFCDRAGLSFRGGVGVGGGVMLNVTRILFVVQVGLLLLNTVLSAVKTGDFFPAAAWSSFLENAGILLFFNLGVLFYLIRMARCIRKGIDSGKRYTRIMVPSFLFILFADIFFIIISVLQGGIFRGWLSKKQPEG